MLKLADGKSQRKSKRAELLEAIEARIQFGEAKNKSLQKDISLGSFMIKSCLFSKGGLISNTAKIQIPTEESVIPLEGQ